MLHSEILGEEFKFKTDGDDKYLHDLISFIQQRSKKIYSENKNLSKYDVMILTALNIAEELFEMKRLQNKDVIEKTDELYQKHRVPPFNYIKIMKGGHYGIFRPIFRFNKYTDQDRMMKLVEEITDTCLEMGCIPYKTPSWMTAKMREQINPGWLKLFDKIKKCMDPNGIFNPGRWNT